MKKSLFLVGMTFMFFSCNSDNSASSDEKNGNSNKSGKELNCNFLEQFEENYSGLLTKEEMASVYPIDFANAKEKLRNGSYGEYKYMWPSNRPDRDLDLNGTIIKSPDRNSMGIKTFSFDSDISDMQGNIDYFNMAYKELSKEELDKIDKNLAKQNEETKATGEDLMKVRGNRSWEFVDGLGSSAWYKWNELYGGELAVLAGQAKFYIDIKISSDPDENRELAKKLAEKVIAKCK